MNQVCIYFILFMIYSVIGWFIEVIGKLITEHRFINRGFFIGPYCPIYGWGGLLMTLLFKRYLEDPVVLFILIVLLCSLLEYLTSYFMEKVFKLRWWDYNHFKFNINGRICLETMIPFGFGGLLVMYVLSPFFLGLLENMNSPLLYSLAGVLFVVYFVDSILSERIILDICKIGFDLDDSIVKKYKNVKDNTEMIKEYVASKILESKNYLHERLIKAFPNFKVDIVKLKDLLDNFKKK